MRERIAWIDIAKGICMISVILGHLGVTELGFVYSYHLTVFFILSGYTLRKTAITNDYLKNKFLRLMIPYFLTCITVTVMEVLNTIIIQRNFSTASITKLLYTNVLRSFFASGTHQYMGNIKIGHCIGAIWFLPALFFCLVFTQIILNVFRQKMQIVSVIAIALIGCVSSQLIWLPFSIQAAMLAVPFLFLGMCLKEYQILEKIKGWHYMIFAVIFLMGCITGYAQVFYMVTCTMKDWLFTPICAICSSLLIIGISRKIGHFSPLEFIGKNSLIFLCVHLFEINTLPRYFSYARKLLHIPDNRFSHFMMEMLFVCVVSYLLVRLVNRKARREVVIVQFTRDFSLDIMRSLMIVLMIVGHTKIDSGASRLIYSIHMMAFVMISGYFYKSGIPLRTNLKKAFKTLIPYGVFAVWYVVVTHQGWVTEVRNIFMGISFTDKYFTWTVSVGPVYFILLLFVVKVLYMCIERCRNECIKNGIVFVLFALGIFMGNQGIWLPWSLDCALFSLLFYHIAHYMCKWDILQKCKKSPYIYFILSCVWALMIHKGSMELAMRKYGNVGLTISGVISAFVLIYLLCDGIVNNLPIRACEFISLIGQSTAHILVIHTLFGGKISAFVREVLFLNPQNIFHLGVSVLIHTALGVVVFLIVKVVKNIFKIRSRGYVINYSRKS